MTTRRTFTAEFKAKAVLSVLSGAKTAADVCREHRIKESVFGRWKRQFLERAPELFEGKGPHPDTERRIAELEQMVGKLAMELEIAKKSLAVLGPTRAEKQAVTRRMRAEEGYPVAQICRVLGLSRSSYYYQAAQPEDGTVLAAIDQVLAEFPTYGSRRVNYQLRREPYRLQVNRKRVQRIIRAHDRLQPVKRAQTRTTNSRHPYRRYPNRVLGLAIERPDQVWVSDITYIRLQRDFVYLAIVMDVFTRVIRGWQLRRHLDQQLTLDALNLALEDHLPEIHHSDQGVQYAGHEYVDVLRAHGIQLSMAAVGASEENPFAERLIRTIKEEEVNLAEYLDFGDAYAQIGHFIEQVYQFKRIHSSLGYLTPAEFENHWQQQATLISAS